ncbi:MAG: hypothetical protein CMH04_02255 [Marinovum sp.]|nr:hypothetical protein [Marinovum sp.]
MPIFKPKPSKQITVNPKAAATLDSKHSSMCDSFDDDDRQIRLLKKERKILRSKSKEEVSIVTKQEINDRLKEIKKQVALLEERRSNYFLDNSALVFDYFERKKQISTAPVEEEKGNSKVDSFFKITKDISGGSATGDSAPSGASDVQKYLSNVDESFLDVGNFLYPTDICRKCNEGELIPVEHEGIMVCNNCSAHVAMLIENEKPSYKEPPKEVCFYAYKRINHFREILAQFQAKETTQIPEEVLDNIRRQIQKERITLANLTNKKAKEILKKLGYNKYYEHIPFIKDKLGIRPPIMTPELEETLCSLFMDIQGPYAKHCPGHRVNFLNYYYTVYKLCELLGEDQFLPYFPMLKDMGKRVEQDAIWKQICDDLQWEFIPTL